VNTPEQDWQDRAMSYSEDGEEEEITPLEKAIQEEDFDAVLAILDEARRQVVKQALKRGLALFSPSLVDESVRRPV
jgi:hypothetical protein